MRSTPWILLLLTTAIFAQPPQTREIVRITDDLYRARAGNWYTIFLVTDAGIILADPISTEFSQWLAEEIDRRFDVPVRYVIYSHSHFDHARGGDVFADTATFIGHENMLRNMDGRYPQMPGDMIDRDHNGLIDWDDIMVPTQAHPGICGWGPSFFDIFDRDGDARVSPQELFAEVRKPDVVFADHMQITLGDKTVWLAHPGRNHSDDATVILFPEERGRFATEFLADALVTDNIRALPSACGPFDGTPLQEWIASYRFVEELDFDRIAPGHGDMFDKAYVTETRVYFERLTAAVSAGMARGESLQSLRDNLQLTGYEGWANYERLRGNNIEAAYYNLSQR